MKTFLECVPCMLRQALDAGQMATESEEIREQIMREVLKAVADEPFTQSPPHLARKTHRIIKKLSKTEDPYLKLKHRYTDMALEMLPELEKIVVNSENQFRTSARIAVAGNIIDFGLASVNGHINVEGTIADALERPFALDELGTLEKLAKSANSILYLADNAGELVFDRLLLEHLPLEKTAVVVKGSPIINDAIRDDAIRSGLEGKVEIIDNGDDAPGTILDTCPEDFRKRFYDTDLVIAKGQGNYETLSECGHKALFFLLKIKCPVIARDIGCEIGDIVATRHNV